AFYGTAITPSLLRQDPTWNPLRNDPDFQKLLKEFHDTKSMAAWAPAKAEENASMTRGQTGTSRMRSGWKVQVKSP
ncbi:MAG: hypothetical protein ACREFZ_08240, partial [Acetobacteraceae bacterium]